MALHIRRINYSLNSMRLTIPRQLCERRGWAGDKYIIIDDGDSDILILRRFKIGQGKNGTDSKCSNSGD